MLHKEVIKHYKKVPPSLEADLNQEAELIAFKFKVNDWIGKFKIKNFLISLKDQNGDFS